MFYRRYIKNHFFGKILILYLLITLFSGVVLFITLSDNLMRIKREEALTMSDQILSTVDSFLSEKIQNTRKIQQRLIQNKTAWVMLTDRIKKQNTEEYYMEDFQNDRENIMQNIYAVDREVYGILFLGNEADIILRFGNMDEIGNSAFLRESVETMKSMDKTRIYMVPDRKSNNKSNAFPFFLFSVINDPDNFTSQIGVLGLCFSARNLPHVYQKFDQYRKGEIYVLDEEGRVLFDSSEEYEDAGIPFSELEGRTSCVYNEQGYFFNSIYSRSGYYVVNKLPVSLIREDVRVLQFNIFGVLALVMAVAFIMNFLSTRLFSRRVKKVLDVIDQVRGGNFTDFPAVTGPEDEIGVIHRELIRMGEELKNHIDKEYVYQLQQKEMELYALQTQINPHFLYNSLESIRMYLYMVGEEKGSHMIELLSDLFRNIMKKRAVVTFREEIRYLQSYLEFHRFRMGNRMNYEIDIPDEVYRYAAIRHILQPTVENALVHGIEEKNGKETSVIRISARVKEGDILVYIQDDGAGITEERLKEIRAKLQEPGIFQDSIGIYNVNSRLRIVYGEKYGLNIDSRENEGTQVILRMKAMRKKELENYVQNTYSR